MQDKIFTPFYTSKETGHRPGLAIVRKLVEAHGGAIELDSTPRTGTEFVLSFPKQGREPEAHVKPRILVVEDERGIQLAIRGLLRREGYEVELADNGETRRSASSRRRPST